MATSGSVSRRTETLRIRFKPGDPWILLSMATASFRGPCSLRNLIAAADYINHAIPSRAEIEGGVNRLAGAGLIYISSKGFALTAKARQLLIRLESKSRSLYKQWRSLEVDLPMVKPIARKPAHWQLPPDRYRQAIIEYQSAFEPRL